MPINSKINNNKKRPPHIDDTKYIRDVVAVLG